MTSSSFSLNSAMKVALLVPIFVSLALAAPSQRAQGGSELSARSLHGSGVTQAHDLPPRNQRRDRHEIQRRDKKGLEKAEKAFKSLHTKVDGYFQQARQLNEKVYRKAWEDENTDKVKQKKKKEYEDGLRKYKKLFEDGDKKDLPKLANDIVAQGGTRPTWTYPAFNWAL